MPIQPCLTCPGASLGGDDPLSPCLTSPTPTHPWRPAGVVLDAGINASLSATLLALILTLPSGAVVAASLWVEGGSGSSSIGAARLWQHQLDQLAKPACLAPSATSTKRRSHLPRGCATLAARQNGLALRRRLLHCGRISGEGLAPEYWSTGMRPPTHLCWALVDLAPCTKPRSAIASAGHFPPLPATPLPATHPAWTQSPAPAPRHGCHQTRRGRGGAVGQGNLKMG